MSELSAESVSDQRLRLISSFLSRNKLFIQYLLLFAIIFIGFSLRLENLDFAKDITTNDYIPIEPDSFVILRYVKEVLSQGFISPIDTLRYVPLGYTQVGEFSFIAYFCLFFK